ncbi:hypothetical protein NESM_000838700 [Novymonas esmeraldas]|uniref:Uncharacterized protein n=1 Tax=Novymonas esmeraldas TaxID=1808958 RepID=A0AAW0EZ22_9TRYP
MPTRNSGAAPVGDSTVAAAASSTVSASPAPPVVVRVVSSAEDFASVFVPHGAPGGAAEEDALLLCYEHPGDGVTADALLDFQQAVTAAALQHGAGLRLFVWDCTSPSFAAARAQLDKSRGHPLLLIITRGAIADTVRGVPLVDVIATDVPRVCSRLASFQSSAKPARVVVSDAVGGAAAGAATERRLSVDVAKVVGMGKGLMAQRQPLYAEKFFVKALSTLDAVAADVDLLVASREDYDGSVAMCLAWAGLARLVQGTGVVENAYLERLDGRPELQCFCEEPLSDASRAMTTWHLMRGAPRTWSEAQDSETKLRAALSAAPDDTTSRSLLVVTLFLRGDLERAMTEALKLHVSGNAFGRLALTHMSAFLGPEHVLVRQLGIPELSEHTTS